MIQQIHDKYGLSAMREIWIEELLELATVLQRSKRENRTVTINDLRDEIADVDFCIDQMKHIYGEVECDEHKHRKMDRTRERLL